MTDYIFYREFQRAMIDCAKKIQGEHYVGDDYYLQECWRDNFDGGDSPEDAVCGDMDYWES